MREGHAWGTAWSKFTDGCPRCAEIMAWRFGHPELRIRFRSLVLMSLVAGEAHLHPHDVIAPRQVPSRQRVLGDVGASV